MALLERQSEVVEGDLQTAPAAQLFMALTSHLDQVHPQSVGSLARLSSKNGDCNRGDSR
jgi:hypothetical protein